MKLLKEARDESSIYGLIDDRLHDCEHFPYFVVRNIDKKDNFADVELVNFSPSLVRELKDQLTMVSRPSGVYEIEEASANNRTMFRIWFSN